MADNDSAPSQETTVLEAKSTESLLQAAQAWRAGKPEAARAWEQAAAEWNYGDSEAAEAWEHVAEAWTIGENDQAQAWERVVESEEKEEARAWEQAARAKDEFTAAAWGWAATARAEDESEIAMTWELIAESRSPQGPWQLAEVWERAAKAWAVDEVEVTEAWKNVARMWMADMIEVRKAEEHASHSHSEGNIELARVWGRMAETRMSKLMARAHGESERAEAVERAAKTRAVATGNSEMIEAWKWIDSFGATTAPIDELV